ncbi:MAG TPA: hypothetical protein PK587_04275 [Syntrophales bacterium]|nr:hypothetical protein [Syntrophales bacterium]
MKKKGLSEAELQVIGRMMVDAYEKLLSASTKFANAYPRNSEPYVSLKKSIACLATARNKADNLFFKENPNSKLTHVYYGQPPKSDESKPF